MKNKEILKEFQSLKNLKKITLVRYQSTLSKYSNFHETSLNDLLEEAEKQEDHGIRLRKRKIKNRLSDFKNYLIK